MSYEVRTGYYGGMMLGGKISDIGLIAKTLDVPGITDAYREAHQDAICIRSTITTRELLDSKHFQESAVRLLCEHKSKLEYIIDNNIGTIIKYSGKRPEYMGSQLGAAQAQQSMMQNSISSGLENAAYKQNPFLALAEKTKEKTMFGEFKKDIKGFFTEHKGIIYSIIGLYLLDHFVLEGKLKAKLLDLSHRILGKVENKIDSMGAPQDGKK